MKKRNIAIAIIIFIIISTMLVIFLNNNIKIPLIDKIKQTAKVGENTSSTTIDVTYLEDNGNLDHEHIFKTMYDENKHWEECTVCGQKQNETAHNYTGYWNLGTESCHYSNYYKNTCDCGYSYIWHKPCVWDGNSYLTNNAAYMHHMKCSVCKEQIIYSYYYREILYSDEHESGWNCSLSNGNEINCKTLGTCSKCKFNYNEIKHYIVSNNESELRCRYCNQKFGTFTQEINKDSNTPITYTVINNVNLTNGATFYALYTISTTSSLTTTNFSLVENNNTQFTTKSIIKSTAEGLIYAVPICRVKINNVITQLLITQYSTDLYADLTEPTISSIAMKNVEEELTEWSKTKPIIISGTENFCKTVNVRIIDEQENIIFEGTSNVSDNNYTISCTPELECDTNGRIFKAIVTDNCNNSIEQEFKISKVDAIPPTPTSGKEILGDWAKSKDFTFTATDYGIGQVSIAFNDIEDLKLANVDVNTYSRDYTFTGDVYIPKQLSVMYKDGLGNTSMQKITIDRLDNTAPTITNATIHNNKVTITSHDRHETLGEGSGVVKYRYLASEAKIANPELTTENSEESTNAEITIEDIYKMKYIYIIAEDYVGNVSEVYEFEVPQLILTSTVNLNTTDGKGEIILDWSSYDVSDKYFVVYRKRDNQAEWEEIVSLTQKLIGSTYTDKLGNDKAKPDVPNITITENATNNNINVTANSTDNGTNYKYYIEAYDSAGTLLSKSN